MKITQKHLLFWMQKKSSVPCWAKHLIHIKVDIDDLIPGHSRNESVISISNTIVILKSARNRGQLKKVLEEMSKNARCSMHPEKREAHCKKWLARINKQQGERNGTT